MPVPKSCDWNKAKHKRCVKKVLAKNRSRGYRANPYAVCSTVCKRKGRASAKYRRRYRL